MSSTVFRRIIPTFATAFGLQAAMAAVFVPLQNERFYDFGGAAGFISSAFVSLYGPYLRERYWVGNTLVKFPPLSSHHPRQLLLTGALVFWAGRLGSFLFARVLREGKDSRFDEIKKNPGQFAGMWMGQALWVFVVGLPVYLVNAVPVSAQPALNRRDLFGLGLFASSLLFEIVADQQKSQWRKEKKEKKHDEAFISSGLWSISRHPNYVGEIGIHTGIWLAASAAASAPVLPRGMTLLTALSPLFMYVLLTKGSGVPPLEISADKKFGSDPKYQEYKKKTPIFFPWGPAGDFRGKPVVPT